MQEKWNASTQKYITNPIFNNWSVINEGWYFVCPSKELKKKSVHSFFVGPQKLVAFRGENNQVRVLDSFCPHMGTDLAIGKVINNSIRCFFHHWQFDGHGNCRHKPNVSKPKHKHKLMSYSVCEKFGMIWVNPHSTPHEMGQFLEYKDTDQLVVQFDQPYQRSCHHHITMINGLDVQHLKTVHNLNIELDLTIDQKDDIFFADLKGNSPNKSITEKIFRFLLGPQYGYSMKYSGASIGFLTIMKHVRLSELTMIFAYRPNPDHTSTVQPIYVTKKRNGLFGKLINKITLYFTKRAFYYLRDEDGLIYENMRFQPNQLEAEDAPIRRYIQYVNSLKPSLWSQKKESIPSEIKNIFKDKKQENSKSNNKEREHGFFGLH